VLASDQGARCLTMSDPRHEEIGRELRDELRRTQREYTSANENFDAIVRETPSGLPHPDGALRVQQAGKESRRTLDLYTRALKRYTEFILHGVAPPPD